MGNALWAQWGLLFVEEQKHPEGCIRRGSGTWIIHLPKPQGRIAGVALHGGGRTNLSVCALDEDGTSISESGPETEAHAVRRLIPGIIREFLQWQTRG